MSGLFGVAPYEGLFGVAPQDGERARMSWTRTGQNVMDQELCHLPGIVQHSAADACAPALVARGMVLEFGRLTSSMRSIQVLNSCSPRVKAQHLMKPLQFACTAQPLSCSRDARAHGRVDRRGQRRQQAGLLP